MKKILKILFSLNSNIRKSYKRNEYLISFIHNEGEHTEDYFYLTYKDYDRLRILMINIIFFIKEDIKNNRRKNKEKIKRLMEEVNNTYLFFTYPFDKYLVDFQKMVYRVLFRYYKDYIYKARIEYDKYENYHSEVLSLFDNLKQFEFGPFQLKNLIITFKKFN